MGKQFSYYCSPEDLDEIDSEVLRPMRASLVDAQKVNRAHVLVPTPSLSLSREKMGVESTILYLFPPEELRNIVFDGPWLSSTRSNVVEVGRSLIRDGLIREARFWYETRFLEDGLFVEKPAEFVAWAEQIFKQTKKKLTRRPYLLKGHAYTEWFGKVAWDEVQRGTLHPT